VERLIGDRLEPRDLRQLAGQRWDVAVDTWAGAPRAARDSAAILADRVDHFVYVSSVSVYAPPPPRGVIETAATVPASPDADDGGDYAERKRGAELAVQAAFGTRALLARAGLILGPYEDVGRLPWWLLRMDRGGEVLAPGPADMSIAYIDARDLATWMLDAAARALGGAYNVVSRSGHATMGTLLEACRQAAGPSAELTWVDPAIIERAGIAPWTELPIWLPPEHEYRGNHEADVERAHGAGLRCRPVEETARDTWDWLLTVGKQPPLRPDLDPPGLDPVKERAVLDAWDGSRRARPDAFIRRPEG
jgi:nucleoside-diphosphate-sugar epimerase